MQAHGQYKATRILHVDGFFSISLRNLHHRPAVYWETAAKPLSSSPPSMTWKGSKNYRARSQTVRKCLRHLKIHGSNGRYQFGSADQKMHVGSHNYWKSDKSTCIWRRALTQSPWLSESATPRSYCILRSSPDAERVHLWLYR